MALKIGLVVFENFFLHHMAVPLSVFEIAAGYDPPTSGIGLYTPIFLSKSGGLVKSSTGIHVDTKPFATETCFDHILVSGGFGCAVAEFCPGIRAFLRDQAETARSISAIASGALILGATGLLDGRRATTHWSLLHEFATRYPKVTVDADQRFFCDGKYWTCSTTIASVQVAQQIVATDYDEAIALRASSDMRTVPTRHMGARAKGHHGRSGDDRFLTLLKWARQNLREPLSVESLAEKVGMNTRNFVPAFTSSIGMTPAKAIERIRIEAAIALIESSDTPLRDVAARVGYADPERMRRAFIRALGKPAQAFREVVRQIRPPIESASTLDTITGPDTGRLN